MTLNTPPGLSSHFPWCDGDRHVLPAVHADTVHILAHVIKSISLKSYRSCLPLVGTFHLELDLTRFCANRLRRIWTSRELRADIPSAGSIHPKDEVSSFIIPMSLVCLIRTKNHMNAFRNFPGLGIGHNRSFDFYELAGISVDSTLLVGFRDVG